MTDRELCNYKMSHDELNKWEDVLRTIKKYCQMTIPLPYRGVCEGALNWSVSGYSSVDGYYYIELGDRDNIHFVCRSMEKENILFVIMKEILEQAGRKIEMKNRNSEAKKWEYYQDYSKTKPGHIHWVRNENFQYHARHDTRKVWFEFVIEKLLVLFPYERVEPVIKEYTDLINRWFVRPHWAYDRNKKCFIEISRSAERS